MTSPERTSGRVSNTATLLLIRGGITPSTIMSPASESGPSTEIRLGVFFSVRERTSSDPRVSRERGPPKGGPFLEVQTGYPRLTCGTFTDKERNV
jgi:hypothetical protein